MPLDQELTTGRGRWITVEGARTQNLRNVSVGVPKHQLTVFTGVSGSGKSSLAFDTIASEAERLVTGTYPTFVRNRLPQHPPADVDRLDGLVFTTIVDQRRFTGNAVASVVLPRREPIRRALAGVLVQRPQRDVPGLRGARRRRRH